MRGRGLPPLLARPHGRPARGRQRRDPAPALARAARPARGLRGDADRRQPARRRGHARQAQAGARRVIRLAVRVPRAAAEIVLAELLELVAGGAGGDRRQRGRGRVRALRGRGRAAGPARAAGGRGRRAGRRLDLGGARRLGRPLEGVAPAGRRRLALPAAAACGRRGRRRWPRSRGSTSSSIPARRSGRARTTRRGCASSCCSSSTRAARWRTGARAAACWRSRRRGSATRRCWRSTSSRRRWRRRRRTPRATAPRSRCRRVNLRREPAPWAPTVTANLVRPLLLDVARLLERAPERLIASGLLQGGSGRGRGGVRGARPASSETGGSAASGPPCCSTLTNVSSMALCAIEMTFVVRGRR